MPSLRPVLLALLAAAGVLARPAPVLAQPDVQMCSGQPVPPGYVVVGTASRGDCPSEFGASYNSLTIRLPGDTVTVCSELSRLPEGYVITRRSARGRCPSAFGASTNSATYQRVGHAPGRPGGETDPFGSFTPMNQYDRTVFRRMGEVAAWLRLETPTHHPWLSRAAHATTANTPLELEGGVRYTVVAACDEDCGDIGLRVLDGGYLLAEDVDGGDHAFVELSPARGARLTVEVVMAACEASPCHFVVGVYETPRPGALPPLRPPGGDVRVTPRPQPRP